MNQQTDNILGNILLADDEQTFLEATAQLLRNEGFDCDIAENTEQTLKKLSQKNYDLLIADIKMPGNLNLELVQKASSSHPAMSIILITGYPSQQTAIAAVTLPVTAYILKPLDLPELLQKTKSAVKVSMLYKTVNNTKNNIMKWVEELENIELTLQQNRYDAFDAALKSFLSITTAKIDEVFENIRLVTFLLDDIKPNAQVCKIMNCSKLSDLTDGIEQAVNSIKKSREMYKSKQLAEIRTKLEKLLENIQKF
ncbi:MAG: response regulator [Phycisphaerae bacterium]|jgi:response regulator RpfG family c-di-GMP phosphodiesterase